jgi:hypothetical protein
VALTERQWKNRIRQRRELAARAAELEERICTALETRNASLQEVRGWLSEVDRAYNQLRISGYPFAAKTDVFADADLVARLGTEEQRRESDQRQAAASAEKAAKDRISAQHYDAERLSHPKLAQPPKCVHPERLHCDYYGELQRCEFMVYGGRMGYWLCTAGEKFPSK